MGDLRVIFRNEPSWVRVYGKGQKQFNCTPVVVHFVDGYGIGMMLNNSSFAPWGWRLSRDLIASWRATEILTRLSVLGPFTIDHAYFAGSRGLQGKEGVADIIEEIGQYEHDCIMEKPVPELIIRTILDGQNEKNPPKLKPIVDEVEAGMLSWRGEFVDAGLKSPDEIYAWRCRMQEIRARFDRQISSYARFREAHRESPIINRLEKALLNMVGEGADQLYSPWVLIGVAGAVAELPSFEVTEERFIELRDEALERPAKWLAAASRWSWILPWRRDVPIFTVEDARVILLGCLEWHFPEGRKHIPVWRRAA